MKSSSFLRIYSLFICTLFSICTSWSQFENTIGSLDGSDETTDIKPLPNGNTAVLATTTSFGPEKILLIELDAVGNVVLFKTIFEIANPDVEYVGTNLALEFNAANIHVGYFITGCRGSFPTQMILIHTDLLGNPTWAWAMDNGLIGIPDHTISECGIAIERQPNTDIIVVGRSDQVGDLRFSVSRFSAAGVLIWSNRYGSSEGLQFIPNESCNGIVKTTEVITVVGHIHDGGIGHTYLSCIKASTGAEIWRRQYISRHDHDDGTDVVQNPADSRFMVVGHAENLFGGGGNPMWVFNANGNNGILANGATYSVPAPYRSLFARDVCLSPDIKSGTITGFITYDTPFGISETRTYIMKLPFAPGALPDFSHYFTASDPLPFLLSDEAIETIGGANPGYVLGTEAILPGSAPFDYDVHALKLDLLGMHKFLGDCPVVPFTPRLVEEGKSSNLRREKTTSTWHNFIVGSRLQNYLEVRCIEELAPPLIGNIVQALLQPMEVRLYPNPAVAGTDVNIEFELTASSDVGIQLMDVSGRIINEWHQLSPQGKQVMQIPLPVALEDKMYFVRLVFPDGTSKVFRLMII